MSVIHRFHFQNAILVSYSRDADLVGAGTDLGVAAVSRGVAVYPLAEVRSWGFNDAPKGHRFNLAQNTGIGTVAAIVDSGIDCDSPDFVQNGYSICGLSYSFVPGYSPYEDEFGHGTRVASVVAARANNIGVRGGAPEAGVASYRVFDPWGGGATCNSVAAAIDQATYDLRDVINLSLGVLDSPAARQECVLMEAAIGFAYGAGLLVVAAAGNTNGGPVTLPAAYDNAFAVSGVTCGAVETTNGIQPYGQNAEWWAGSAQGTQVDVAAAGEDVATATPAGGVTYRNGTSYAAPHATAAALLLIEACPESRRQAQALAAHLKVTA